MPGSAATATTPARMQPPPPTSRVGVAPPMPGHLEVWFRCYAPFKSFGGGYRGDARTESTDVNKTARIVVIVTVDYARMVVAKTPDARCDESHGHGVFPILMSLPLRSARRDWSNLTVTGRAQPRVSMVVEPVGRPGQGLAAVVSVAGGNPLVPIAPDIDVQLNLKLKRDSDTALLVSGTVVGDGFPNAEVFLRDAGSRTVLVHSYRTPGGTYGPFSYLPGQNARKMGGFGKRVSMLPSGLLNS